MTTEVVIQKQRFNDPAYENDLETFKVQTLSKRRVREEIGVLNLPHTYIIP